MDFKERDIVELMDELMWHYFHLDVTELNKRACCEIRCYFRPYFNELNRAINNSQNKDLYYRQVELIPNLLDQHGCDYHLHNFTKILQEFDTEGLYCWFITFREYDRFQLFN